MPLARMSVRMLTVVQDRGPNELRSFVRCPMQDRSVDAAGCTSCVRLRAIEWTRTTAGAVTCRLDRPPPPAPKVGDKMDFAEAAVRKPLHEVAPPATLCVVSTTRARKARMVLLAYDLDAIPVVDAELRVLGVVTRGDLVGAALDGTVADAVSGREPRTLSEDAPVAHAIALMAYERVNHVPIVTGDGELVGMWDATSALRWTAERMGYVGR